MHNSYDYSGDIDELEGTLNELYGKLSDDITDIDEVEDPDEVYHALSTQVAQISEFPMKASPDIDHEVAEKFGAKVTKSLPFLMALGMVVSQGKKDVLQAGVSEMYNTMNSETNKLYQTFRTKSKEMTTNKAVFDYATKNQAGIPDKVVIPETEKGRQPFKLNMGVNFDLRFQDFNRKAQDYLFGKDFKITSTNITENLKKRLQETLSTGYQLGGDKASMVQRVRDVLGSKSNANVIATTEIASAANFGEYEFAREYRDKYEVEMVKTWWQMERSNKRKTHASVSGQTLKFAEMFSVDGEPMARPHDPNASSHNVINCGCYLSYETGQQKLTPMDDRGIRRFIQQTEQTADVEPYINAERIGAFANNFDAIDYVRDIYGVEVDASFTMNELNAIADTMDAMPFKLMMDNMKLAAIEIGDLGTKAGIAGYTLESRTITFPSEAIPDEQFRYSLAHEVGHSLHYSNPAFFEKFANLAWKRIGEGNMFEPKNWRPSKPFGVYLRMYAARNPKEHFADMVARYMTANAETYAMAEQIKVTIKDDVVLKMLEMFSEFFGPVR